LTREKFRFLALTLVIRGDKFLKVQYGGGKLDLIIQDLAKKIGNYAGEERNMLAKLCGTLLS